MAKDKNATKTKGPEKVSRRKLAKKAARKIKNLNARRKAVDALRTGTAKRKINKRLKG